MKITCHSCGAKYTVSDDKIQGKTVKMKCRKCSATIVVGNAQADGAAAGADAGSPPAGSYLVNVADGDQRTMTAGEIADAYRAGTITDDTYVWADGMSDWQTVLENPEVAAAISGGGAPAPAPSFQGVPDFEAAAAEPARAARKEPKASRDLFGAAPAASPSAGGLFGSSSSSSSMGSGGASGAMIGSDTGKRDENSVLFSLSALTSVEASAPAGKTTAKKDDSGLIDLKALALSAPAASSVSNDYMPDAGAVFPLGMPILAPPPQAAPAVGMDVSAPPPQKSKVGIIVGGAVAIVAMVLVFFLVKGNPPPPPAPTPAQTAATPPPTAAEPTPPPTADPAAEPSASASSSAAPVAKSGGKWPPKGKPTSAPAAGGGTPPAAGGGDPPKPPPAKSKCGCAASDLMCNMKCSTK